MPPLQIDLPEDLRARAEAKAAEAGHASVEQYVQALVRADLDRAGEPPGAPEHLTFVDDAGVESLLLQRMQDAAPGIEATPEFWSKLREEARSRSRPGTGG